MTDSKGSRASWFRIFLPLTVLLAAACVHYPVNAPLARYDPESMTPEPAAKGSDDILLFLSFSGGGTRAAAFSYGVLEQLRDTE